MLDFTRAVLERKPKFHQKWKSRDLNGLNKSENNLEMMNQHQYKNVLEKRLQEWLPNGDSVFMHESAPCHKTKSVTKFLSEIGIKTLSWPGKSLDKNTVENLWAKVKKIVFKKTNI